MPIPGVSVLVKGKFGTQTDFDGKYVINASPSQILFSYIGMLSQVKATSTLVNVKMKPPL
jgi:hypothetical protein